MGSRSKKIARARIDAHSYFDPLWQFGLLERNEAYKMLAIEMGLTNKECHIKLMTEEQALSVREHAAEIRRKVEESRSPQGHSCPCGFHGNEFCKSIGCPRK